MGLETNSNLNFNKKQFYRQVVTIALPIAIQELITTSLSLVDNVMVGIPLAFIGAFYLKLPVYLVLLLIKGEEVAKCIVVTVRLISNKWANNIIKNIEG